MDVLTLSYDELYASQTTTHDFEDSHTKLLCTMALFTMDAVGDAMSQLIQKGRAPDTRGVSAERIKQSNRVSKQ